MCHAAGLVAVISVPETGDEEIVQTCFFARVRDYPGVQKGPSLPSFFRDKISADAYSFSRER